MNEHTLKEAGSGPEKKKMEALGRVSCKVAHDFNNILSAIEGYATLAAMNAAGKDAVLTRDLQEIHLAVAEAAALGKQLLVFGGMQMLNKTHCGVNDIITDTLKRAELAPEDSFKIETKLEPGLPDVIGDAAQLEQALANLLVNAREAMPGGGTAVISTSALRLEGGAVHSPDPQAAGTMFIKISVRDSGEGISPEVFEHLFEPLYSTRKTGRKAGLGLSMVYGLVKQHNGWVEVITASGQGSEFSIFLPAICPTSGHLVTSVAS